MKAPKDVDSGYQMTDFFPVYGLKIKFDSTRCEATNIFLNFIV